MSCMHALSKQVIDKFSGQYLPYIMNTWQQYDIYLFSLNAREKAQNL